MENKQHNKGLKIVGLTGKARSGKDTVAMRLATHYGYHHYWFSRPMKEACRNIFGWGDEHLYGDLKDVVDTTYGVSPRYVLQTIGTDWGRDMINRDLWLIRAQQEMDANPLIVVSDVRFDNEASLIRSNGGSVIRLGRDDLQQVNPHQSENGVSDGLITRTIENNGTLDELNRLIDSLFGGAA